MVEVGLGIAFLPDMVTSSEITCEGEALGRLFRISVGPSLSRNIDLVTWKNFETSRATEACVQEIRDHAAKWKGCVEVKCA